MTVIIPPMGGSSVALHKVPGTGTARRPRAAYFIWSARQSRDAPRFARNGKPEMDATCACVRFHNDG